MSVNLKQNADASMGLQGTDGDDGQFIPVTFNYSSANTLLVFTLASLSRRAIVKQIYFRPDVVSTNAVTATFYKAASGTAIGSGTALHTGTANLQGTAATNQKMTLTASACDVSQDSSIGMVISGALGAAGSGSVTIWLAPA